MTATAFTWFGRGRRGLRGIIDRHNQLNGQLFSSVEFALITLVTGPFAVYYLTHERLPLALLFGGMAANSATVVGYAINTMVRSGHGAPAPGTIWNAQARVQLRHESPHMLRDTMLLTTTTLLPFLLVFLLAAEAIRVRQRD